MPRLICITGMNKGEEYPLAEGATSFGRSDKNHICVFDIKSSRRHGIITVENGEVFVEDLKSTNGTKVNNANVSERVKLNWGDHIRIGQTVFMLDEGTKPDHAKTTEEFPVKEKLENLLRSTAFQVTTTTSIGKMKGRKRQPAAKVISFFDKNKGDGDDH